LQCSEPLALWSLVAGGVVMGVVLVFLLDITMPSWKGLTYQFRVEPTKDKETSWFTVLSIVQITVSISFVAVFVYGAYAVLAIFGRQRNASPGTEVCDRRLYDPLFFIIILFDLVLVIGLLLAICLNCDAMCCCCPPRGEEEDRAAAGGVKGPAAEAASGSSKRRDASRGVEEESEALLGAAKQPAGELVAAASTGAAAPKAPVAAAAATIA